MINDEPIDPAAIHDSIGPGRSQAGLEDPEGLKRVAEFVTPV